MPKQANSASLRLCQTRAEIPDGAQVERDFDRTMRRERLHLVTDELRRKSSSPPPPPGFFSRLRQAIDLLLKRGDVWVERRRH